MSKLALVPEGSDGTESHLPTAAPRDAQTLATRARRKWFRIRSEESRMADGWAAWSAAVASGADASPKTLGEAAAALLLTSVRDAVLVSMVPGTSPELAVSLAVQPDVQGSSQEEAVGLAMERILDRAAGVQPGVEAHAALEVLERVIAHNRSDCAPAWTLWGIVHWWSGRDDLADVAIARALEQNPVYRLARLLGDMRMWGMPPGWILRQQG